MTIKILLFSALLGFAAVQAPAATIGLCNTGFSLTTPSCGPLQSQGSPDANYTLLATSPTGAGPALVVNQTGFPIGTGHWLAPTPISQWIGPVANQNDNCCPTGTYDYQLNFTVTLAPAIITGRWASDNEAIMLLDGLSGGTPSASFSTWTPFTLNAGVGTHTLDFLVTNQGGPTGLRVEFTDGEIPEPSTLVSLGAGLLALAFVGRKRHLQA